jgi:hypothetical protein
VYFGTLVINAFWLPQVLDVGPAGEDDDDDYSAFAEFDDPSPAVDASDLGSEFDWDRLFHRV